jgi:16S rRNA (guanine527-N7)-methyltransferase
MKKRFSKCIHDQLYSKQVLVSGFQEEVEAAKAAVELLGASKVSLCAVDSEGPLGQRTAVVCLKDHATPAKYPRRAGMPNKRPL